MHCNAEERWRRRAMDGTNKYLYYIFEKHGYARKVHVKNIGLLLNVVFNQILTNNNNI